MIRDDIFKDPIARAIFDLKRISPWMDDDTARYVIGQTEWKCPKCGGGIVLLDWDKEIIGCIKEDWKMSKVIP